MPITLKYVHELPWKATSAKDVEIDGHAFALSDILIWNYGPRSINGTTRWFSKECQAKLLAAMDNFGKAEESKDWKAVKEKAEEFSASHSRCLLELRAGLEKLEAKLEELSKK